MSLKLSDLHIGTPAILDHFAISPLHRKMLSMGFLPGQKISVLRKVPLQGSLYVRVGNRHIAVRHTEAQKILVRI